MSAFSSAVLHAYCSGRVSWIKLTRPEQHNALSHSLIADLDTALEAAEQNEKTKIILLAAEGPSFCAGADLGDLRLAQSASEEANLISSHALRKLFVRLYYTSKPVVAMVQGAAIGGGCGLVAACDFVLAAQSATFACPEVRIGFVPAIIMRFLLQAIGKKHTHCLTLSGERLSAQRAYEIGLVHSVHVPEELQSATEAFVARLVQKNSASAMQLTKKLLRELPEQSLEQALDHAAQVNAKARASSACQLGISRFLAKEMQDWSKQ